MEAEGKTVAETRRHKESVKATANTATLKDIYVPTNLLSKKVCTSEILWSMFVADHHLPISVSDHFTIQELLTNIGIFFSFMSKYGYYSLLDGHFDKTKEINV